MCVYELTTHPIGREAHLPRFQSDTHLLLFFYFFIVKLSFYFFNKILKIFIILCIELEFIFYFMIL